MVTKKRTAGARTTAPDVIVNIVGAVSYMFLTAAGLVAAMLVMLTVLATPLTSVFLPQEPSRTAAPVTTVPTAQPPEIMSMIVSSLFVSMFLVLSLVLLIALPFYIGKHGAQICRRILRGLRLPVTLSSLLMTKAVLTVLTLLVSFILLYNRFVPALNGAESITVLAIIFVIGDIALLGFVIQTVLAKILRSDTQKVW